jgi:hypothetical protein
MAVVVVVFTMGVMMEVPCYRKQSSKKSVLERGKELAMTRSKKEDFETATRNDHNRFRPSRFEGLPSWENTGDAKRRLRARDFMVVGWGLFEFTFDKEKKEIRL